MVATDGRLRLAALRLGALDARSLDFLEIVALLVRRLRELHAQARGVRGAFVGCVSSVLVAARDVHICSISIGQRKPLRYFIVHTSSFQRLVTRLPCERRDEGAEPPSAPIGCALSISAAVRATRFERNSIQPSEKCDARLRFAPVRSLSLGCR